MFDAIGGPKGKTLAGVVMYDLIVLGASNEILLDGYVVHMSQARAKSVINLSLGACGSSAGVYRWLGAQDVQAPVALLSYEINEFATMYTGLRSDDDIARNWRWLVNDLRNRGIVPVLLILPRAISGRLVAIAARDLQRKIAADLDIHFLDLTDSFLTLQDEGYGFGDFLKDNSHINARVSVVIGDLVLACCAELTGQARVTTAIKSTQARMRRVKPQSLAATPTLTPYKTRLMESEFLTLTPDNPATLSLADDEAIFAVGLNKGVVGGIVEFRGDLVVTKDLSFLVAFEKRGNPQFIIADIRDQIGPADGLVALAVVGKDAAVTEPTLHKTRHWDGGYGVVELDFAIVSSRSEHVVAYDYQQPDHPRDLLSPRHAAQVLADLRAGVDAAKRTDLTAPT